MADSGRETRLRVSGVDKYVNFISVKFKIGLRYLSAVIRYLSSEAQGSKLMGGINPSVYRSVLKIIGMDVISEEKVHAELCGCQIIARLVEE